MCRVQGGELWTNLWHSSAAALLSAGDKLWAGGLLSFGHLCQGQRQDGHAARKCWAVKVTFKWNMLLTIQRQWLNNNNLEISWQNPIPTNKLGVEPKRPGRPVNITHQCKILATAANQIVVSWNSDPSRVSTADWLRAICSCRRAKFKNDGVHDYKIVLWYMWLCRISACPCTLWTSWTHPFF